MPYNDGLVWLDTVISQGVAANASPQRGPAGLTMNKHLILDGLKINSTIDAMEVTYCDGFSIQNCDMVWNGGLGDRQAPVSHFWGFGGGHHTYFRNCTGKGVYDTDHPKTVDPSFRKLNGHPANDGEFLIAERLGTEADNICGTSTGATATTLTCAGGNFSTLVLPCPLVINAGPGLLQQREIIAASGDTVTISRPWDVLPAGSGFSTCPWTVDYCNIENCATTDVKRSVLIYYAHVRNLRIVGMKVKNGGAIDLASRYARDGVGQLRVTTMFNPYLCDNEVDGSQDPANGSGICVHPNSYGQPAPLGVMMVNVHVLRNKVTSYANTQEVIIDAPIQAGITVYNQYQSLGQAYQDKPDLPLLLNAVVDQNETTNCMWGTLVSTGIHNAVVRGAKLKNCLHNVVNQTLDGSATNALNLVEIGTTILPPT